MYLAHKSDDGRTQTILQHLKETAAYAANFAAPFHAEEIAYQTGMAHDIGKYSSEFQKRILENGPRVDHATAGAREIYNIIGYFPAYCVAGHHGGLPDGGSRNDSPESSTLCAKLKCEPGKELPDYRAFAQEISLRSASPPLLKMTSPGGFNASFFTRMLFSCLVDADYLGTEAFMKNRPLRGGVYDGIPTLYKRLEERIAPLWNAKNDLNRKRCEILRACLDAGAEQQGLYSLTVPTGGGKTLSSLAFALRHAKEHGGKRVIYVIPYTSIIEQTADVFRTIAGDKNVLEHHSNVSYDDGPGKDRETRERHRLSAENWDAPIVVTTNVQFFESLYASKSSRCRKLHNIAGSVLVFDEAQMIPLPYLKPCVRAIEELVNNYGCTAVLCTATQPSLQKFFPAALQPREICPNTAELHRFFRRTTFQRLGRLTDRELAERLNAHKQVLCIVNLRQQSGKLFSLLKGEGIYYLTTLMTPVHRHIVLAEIRERLKNHLPCRVVATSLMEAGVDVDFPVVYRAQSGLDSEIQAAGRCNRENKQTAENSPVYLFRPEEDYEKHYPKPFRLLIEAEAGTVSQYEDIASPEAIQTYFNLLHILKGNDLDEKNIVKAFENGANERQSYPFAKVGEEFKLIEQATKSVLIPIGDDACRIARKLSRGLRTRELLQKAGRYSVGLYPNAYRELLDQHAIQPLDDELAVLLNLNQYSSKTGLNIKPEMGIGYFL